MKKQINICIGGVKGYVGAALLKLIGQHPYLHLSAILVKDSASHHDIAMPLASLNDVAMYTIDELLQNNDAIDILLLATPPEVSIEIVSLLRDSQIKIIDLSGAFRLSQDELSQWYGISHDIPELIQGAPYGLSPWGYKNLSQHTVIANPGCYPTCTLLSLIPLLQHQVIESDNIIIDAKSGVSGAGKKTNPDLMFCEMSENFLPYKIGKHQHIPEIKKALLTYTDKECDITFITNLLPIKRGIAMSIYANANPDFKSDNDITEAITNVYQAAYRDYPLIKYGELNTANSTNDTFLLSIKNVVKTPNMHIGFFVENGKIMLFSTIDNLLKGAASQAVENINALYDFPIYTGLTIMEACL